MSARLHVTVATLFLCVDLRAVPSEECLGSAVCLALLSGDTCIALAVRCAGSSRLLLLILVFACECVCVCVCVCVRVSVSVCMCERI